MQSYESIVPLSDESNQQKGLFQEQREQQEQQLRLGHRRRPSIGKSMPVTALLLNFPPPSTQTKNYNSLSRDGLSPELEKPPTYFHLSDVDESSDDSVNVIERGFVHIMTSDNSGYDDVDLGVSMDDKTPDFPSIQGSKTFVPCEICIGSDDSDLKPKPPLKPSKSLLVRPTSPIEPVQELCNMLCDESCKVTTVIKDLEDLGNDCLIKNNSFREKNNSNDMKKSYLKVPSKIDEQRRKFLKDMLQKNNDSNMERSDEIDQDQEVEDIIKNTENFNIKDFREKFAIAEALAKTSMMTSPAARRRLAARKIEMELDYDYGVGSAGISDDEKEFIPPRQLLLYLVRMGSFNSAPKINNTDSQDDSLEVPEGLTNHDLLQHCKIMRGEDRPQLLTRYFLKPVTNNSVISNEITEGLRVLALNAVSRVCSAPVTSSNHIRILQWNILSQSLGQNNDGFIRCPEEALTWENRKYLIVEEIMRNNPDVVCLQEVDHFKFLERVLGSQNYNGLFFPKPDSPCLYIQENNGPDGCAIFYKRDKFDLINFDTRVLEVWRVQSNQVAIGVNLRVLETGKEITVCTTHLKARNGALLSKLRNEQGKDLLRFVNNFAQNRPVLLCGDFNAEPVEPVYSTVLNHKSLKLSSAYADIRANEKLSEKQSSAEHESAEKDKTKEDNNQTNAELSASCEPPYTTWKIREEGEVCHTIDYVFYSKSYLKVLNCLMFPQENEIGQNRTPSFQYPSDHFSLVCDFELLEENY